MITEWLISIGTSVAGWFGGLFPTDDPPSWFVGLSSSFNSITSQFDAGSWVSWTIPVTVTGSVLAVWLTMFGIKAVRAIASYLPFFGGAG